jgi:hypothetical protein
LAAAISPEQRARWHYQIIRLDDDDAQMLRTLAEREGSTVPELIRMFVVWGLENSLNTARDTT